MKTFLLRRSVARRRTAVLLPFVLMVFAAGAASAADIARELQRRYDSVTSLQAEFVQTLTNASTGIGQERAGSLLYKRPQMARWETVKPEPELLVINRGQVWNYVQEEGVAYRYARQDILDSSTLVRLLSGQANLNEDFIVLGSTPEGEWTRLDLQPRDPEPGMVEATLWVDKKSVLIRQVMIKDFFANTNQVRLNDIELNPAIEDAVFEFSPPAGTTILEE